MSITNNIIDNITIKVSEDPNLEVTYEDTYKALVTMIKWTRKFKNISETISPSNYTVSPLMWAKESCTVKFSMSRQSGHTTLIKRMLGSVGPKTPKSELFQNPIVIFPNYNIARNCDFSPEWSWVDLANNLNGHKALGKNLDGVIIDCTSTLSTKEIDRIYKTFQHHSVANPNFVFVFME